MPIHLFCSLLFLDDISGFLMCAEVLIFAVHVYFVLGWYITVLLKYNIIIIESNWLVFVCISYGRNSQHMQLYSLHYKTLLLICIHPYMTNPCLINQLLVKVFCLLFNSCMINLCFTNTWSGLKQLLSYSVVRFNVQHHYVV